MKTLEKARGKSAEGRRWIEDLKERAGETSPHTAAAWLAVVDEEIADVRKAAADLREIVAGRKAGRLHPLFKRILPDEQEREFRAAKAAEWDRKAAWLEANRERIAADPDGFAAAVGEEGPDAKANFSREPLRGERKGEVRPQFNDVQVRAFLPPETTLLRMRKRELLDWLYVACKNWDTECTTVERVTARLRRAENAITETKGETE